MNPGGPGQPYLSVVVPAYNEEERLHRSLSSIGAYFEQAKIDFEILVVDDGSSDGTAAAAESFLRTGRGKLLKNLENRGKGHALRTGVLAARGRWILTTDADLSTPIEEHAKLSEAVLGRDLDIAIGSRALAASQVEVPQHPLRQFMGRCFNPIARWLTGVSFRDTQCGFKLFDSQRTRPLFEKMVVNGFAADVELLMLGVRFGLRVAEIPVVWRNASPSSVSLVGDPPRMVLDVIRMAWRFRRGFYHPDTPSTA